MSPEIREGIAEFICKSNASRAGEVQDDTELLRAGIIDSLKMVELIAYLEESFSINLEPDDLVEGNLNSISNIVAFVSRKRTDAP